MSGQPEVFEAAARAAIGRLLRRRWLRYSREAALNACVNALWNAADDYAEAERERIRTEVRHAKRELANARERKVNP